MMSGSVVTKRQINAKVMQRLREILPGKPIRKRSRHVRSIDHGIVREFAIQYDRYRPVEGEQFCINIDSLPERVVNHLDIYRDRDGPLFSFNQGRIGRLGSQQDRWWLVRNAEELEKACAEIESYARQHAPDYFSRFRTEADFIEYYSFYNKGFAVDIVNLLKEKPG